MSGILRFIGRETRDVSAEVNSAVKRFDEAIIGDVPAQLERTTMRYAYCSAGFVAPWVIGSKCIISIY